MDYMYTFVYHHTTGIVVLMMLSGFICIIFIRILITWIYGLASLSMPLNYIVSGHGVHLQVKDCKYLFI